MSFAEIAILSMPLCITLLSIAFMPLISPRLWQKSEIYFFATISTISILSLYSIIPEANNILKEALIDDYLPFIIMLFTLYVLGHGIHIKLKS